MATFITPIDANRSRWKSGLLALTIWSFLANFDIYTTYKHYGSNIPCPCLMFIYGFVQLHHWELVYVVNGLQAFRFWVVGLCLLRFKVETKKQIVFENSEFHNPDCLDQQSTTPRLDLFVHLWLSAFTIHELQNTSHNPKFEWEST